MTRFDRVMQDPTRMEGQPCIRSLDLTVRQVVEEVAAHATFEEVLRNHPELEEEDIRQALSFSAALLSNNCMGGGVPAEVPSSGLETDTIWEEIDEIIANIPPEEFDKLPTDGSINHDHYLYGWPKKYSCGPPSPIRFTGLLCSTPRPVASEGKRSSPRTPSRFDLHHR